MDGVLGNRLHTEYHVVFLPTLLFLDSNGNVIYRNEQQITKADLLAIGKSIAEPRKYALQKEVPGDRLTNENNVEEIKYSDAVYKEEAEKSEKIKSEITTIDKSQISEEKILYVLDNTGKNKDPHYLILYF
jgi:thioredoxin-related protein